MGVKFIIDFNFRWSGKDVRVTIAHPSSGFKNFLSIDYKPNRFQTSLNISSKYLPNTEETVNALDKRFFWMKPILTFIYLQNSNQSVKEPSLKVRMDRVTEKDTLNVKEDGIATMIFEYVNDLHLHIVQTEGNLK